LQFRKGLTLLVVLLLFAGLMMGCNSSETGIPPADKSVEQKLQGEGQGANPDVPIEVEVTMVEGKITAIEVLNHGEPGGDSIDNVIEQITAAIIAAQNTDVDVIPGAEKTSEGIMEAVANATGM
jgi:uncharacterized protein with FMN-binding domain